jgi:hypothetical protein
MQEPIVLHPEGEASRFPASGNVAQRPDDPSPTTASLEQR